jgi:hypothetical protein
MQAEINAYKVALGNYNNGFLAVQKHVKRAVGWELSRGNDKERACYWHAIKLVKRHASASARWVPHVEKSGVPCPTCVGKEQIHSVLNKFADTFLWTPRGADGSQVQADSSSQAVMPGKVTTKVRTDHQKKKRPSRSRNRAGQKEKGEERRRPRALLTTALPRIVSMRKRRLLVRWDSGCI